MAKGDFKCGSCGRTFSMAAHLARHTSTMHKRRGRPKGSANKAGRRAGRRSPLSQPRQSGAEFNGDNTRVLTEMEAYRHTLLMQRSQIDQRLEGLQNALVALGSPTVMSFSGGARTGATRGKRRGRPLGSKNKSKAGFSAGIVKTGRRGRPGSLRQMIIHVLRQRSQPNSPQQIADGVMKAGYKTKSENLTKSVSNTLPQLAEVRKVGRGLYQIA